MLLNTDPDEATRIDLGVDDFVSGPLRVTRLSRREYFWLNAMPGTKSYDMANPAYWDRGPSVQSLDPAALRNLELAPDSITVVQIARATLPNAELPSVATQAIAPHKGEDIELVLPSQIFVGDSVEGWAIARRGASPNVEALPLPAGSIHASGPLTIDRSPVRLSEGAGRFMVKATNVGDGQITLSAGSLVANHKLHVVPSVPRPTVFWDFETPTSNLKSQWKFALDGSIRPNQQVLRIDLGDFDPTKDKRRELVIIGELPGGDRLAKENIRGVVFDLKVSKELLDVADANLKIVMQSPANYWMVIGDVPLTGHQDWKHHELITETPAHFAAMPYAYNVWFVLEAKSRLRGAVYLDQVGLMVR
jgi:hypothetical protein